MLHATAAFAVVMPLVPGIADAQQKSTETSTERPHMTNANANPGVVDPSTQSNNNTANDRSNVAPTVASKYQHHAQDKVKSKKHKATSPKKAAPSELR